MQFRKGITTKKKRVERSTKTRAWDLKTEIQGWFASIYHDVFCRISAGLIIYFFLRSYLTVVWVLIFSIRTFRPRAYSMDQLMYSCICPTMGSSHLNRINFKRVEICSFLKNTGRDTCSRLLYQYRKEYRSISVTSSEKRRKQTS